MKEGGCHYFNDVFRGIPRACLGGGSCYDETLYDWISDQVPLRNEDIEKKIRSIYPSKKELCILGPALTKKVILIEPLFQWVPPFRDTVNRFDNLPTPLEHLDKNLNAETILRMWWCPATDSERELYVRW